MPNTLATRLLLLYMAHLLLYCVIPPPFPTTTTHTHTHSQGHHNSYRRLCPCRKFTLGQISVPPPLWYITNDCSSSVFISNLINPQIMILSSVSIQPYFTACRVAGRGVYYFICNYCSVLWSQVVLQCCGKFQPLITTCRASRNTYGCNQYSHDNTGRLLPWQHWQAVTMTTLSGCYSNQNL